MVLGQGRPAGGDGPLDAHPEQPDDVGVALAHHHLPAGDDVPLGPVEGVQGAALGVDHRLRGVLVLGRVGTAGQDPSPERHRLARGVADGEQDPGPEGVLQAPPPVDEAQAGTLGDSGGQTQTAAQLVPVVGGPPQPEAAHHLTVVAPAAQVVTGRSGVGALQQPLVVPRHGLLHGPEAGLAAPGVPARGGVLVDGDAGLVGQPAHRVREVQVFDLSDEGDGVTLGLATEAVVHAEVGIDAEGGGLLAVEGAEPRPAGALPLQGGVFADEGHDVGSGPHPGHVLVGDAHEDDGTASPAFLRRRRDGPVDRAGRATSGSGPPTA